MPTDDHSDDSYAGVSFEPDAALTASEAPGLFSPRGDEAARTQSRSSVEGGSLEGSSAEGQAAVAVAEAPVLEADDDEEEESSLLKDLLEWAAVLVAAVALALVFKAFLFQAFWIPSESMESTLQLQDRVLVNKVSYRLHDINRGDVIVFKRPDLSPEDDVKDLIKRVIGVPGESIEGRDGVIYIDGDRLIEPYLEAGVASTSFDFGPIQIEEGTIFVMGDNRERSYDSRYFGTIPQDDVRGRAFILFWPLDRIGGL